MIALWLSRTGFISTSGRCRRLGLDDLGASDFLAGRVTKELSDMFCALKGANAVLLLENPAQRRHQNAFPDDEPVPWTMSVWRALFTSRLIFHLGKWMARHKIARLRSLR